MEEIRVGISGIFTMWVLLDAKYISFHLNFIYLLLFILNIIIQDYIFRMDTSMAETTVYDVCACNLCYVVKM